MSYVKKKNRIDTKKFIDYREFDWYYNFNKEHINGPKPSPIYEYNLGYNKNALIGSVGYIPRRTVDIPAKSMD